ncbi:MAG: hypothetical protein Kow00123_06840 [Anaerolineales bacterium]
MDVSAETTRLTLLVAQVLERLGIRYAVAGSLASSLYGVMRSTLDVDIVADVRPEHIPGLERNERARNALRALLRISRSKRPGRLLPPHHLRQRGVQFVNGAYHARGEVAHRPVARQR